MREVVLKTGVLNGNHFEYELLMQYYYKAVSVAERDLVLKSIAGFRNKRILNRWVVVNNGIDICDIGKKKRKFDCNQTENVFLSVIRNIHRRLFEKTFSYDIIFFPFFILSNKSALIS